MCVREVTVWVLVKFSGIGKIFVSIRFELKTTELLHVASFSLGSGLGPMRHSDDQVRMGHWVMYIVLECFKAQTCAMKQTLSFLC